MAYSFQTFTVGQVLTAAQVSQIEINIRDHVHGAASVSGDVPNTAATQANQETGTSLVTIVTPGRQHFHVSSAKAWLKCDTNGNISASYNITSITDTGGGLLTVTIANDFSSTNYVIVGSALFDGGVRNIVITNQLAGSFDARSNSSADAAADPTNWFFVCYGDL